MLPLRKVFDVAARMARDKVGEDAIKARFGPVVLMTFPFVWASGVIIGCAGIFWALGVEPFRDAAVLSGSSASASWHC